MHFIDLFAGIGGFHQAVKNFDAKCVFACEWDKEAAQVYFDNYAIKPHGDITKIHANAIPVHNLLFAGFPCQAFSISGKQKGFEDARGTLFFDIARILDHHKPKAFLLENVRQFVKHDKGKTLQVVLKTLRDLGYQAHYSILNASHFGLPQNRERVFIVGFRKDLGVNGFEFPSPSHEPVCLLDILETDPKDAKVITRDDLVLTKDPIPPVSLLKTYPNKPLQIGYINKGGQGERIYSPYGHAVTLSAYGGGAGAKTGLYWINGQARKLSPRECARVQGFPETFKLHPSTTQSYKQLGNSVAVKVVEAVIRQMLSMNVL